MLAVVALGVAALLSLGRGSEYSLEAAAEQIAEVDTVAFEMRMSIGEIDAVTMSGALDQRAELMTMTMDMGPLLGATGALGEPSSMELIVDGAAGVVFVGGVPVLDEIAGTPQWVSMGFEQLAAMNGQTPDDLRGQLAIDPGASSELLIAADDRGDVVEVGVEEVAGETLMHYEVSVPTADVLAANPQTEQQLAEFTAAGGVLPETIVYDVWVTEDNELRRMAFEMPVVAETLRVEMTYRSPDEPVEVTIPSRDDVVDISELMPS